MGLPCELGNALVRAPIPHGYRIDYSEPHLTEYCPTVGFVEELGICEETQAWCQA